MSDLDLGKRLRRLLGPEEARAAAELYSVRRRAAGKLANAGALLLTGKLLEQATDRRLAAWRAGRIADLAPGVAAWDATAGAGGEARELAAAGVRVLASDRDPTASTCLAGTLGPRAAAKAGPGAGQGPAGGAVLRADALRPPLLDPSAWLLVIDPDRRAGASAGSGRGRLGDPERWEPPLGATWELAARFAGAVIKLPPGLDPAALSEVRRGPTDPGPEPRLRWVSLGGELKELSLWLGALAGEGPAERAAIALDGEGQASRLEGPPRAQPALDEEAARDAAFLAEPDPAVIRAGLIGNLAAGLGLAPLHPEIAYLGGPEPPGSARRPRELDAGLYRAFRVLGSSPLDPKRVRSLLREHDVGPLTVKKRGHPEPADKLAARLRGKGRRRGLLVVARLRRGHHAWLVEPHRLDSR